MGTVNQIFSGVKNFFRRKDKPKENIKTINQVDDHPISNASSSRGGKHWGRRYSDNAKPPNSNGTSSAIKMAIRTNKTWLQ